MAAMSMFKNNFLLTGLLFFAAAQFLGVFSVRQLLNSGVLSATATAPAWSWWDLVVLVAGTTIFVLLARRGGRVSAATFKLFFIIASFVGLEIILCAWISNLIIAEALAVGLTFLVVMAPNVLTHDIIATAAMTGVGVAISLTLSPNIAIIVLILFSFYDIIAVYVTKHMVTLGRGMIESGSIFGLVLPASAGDLVAPMRGMAPGEQFMILGNGDVLLPILLSGSIARTSLAGGLLVAGFSVVGMALTHYLFTHQRERRAMAALPPIAMLSIIGYLLFVLIGL